MITKESIINWFKENGILDQVKTNVEECTEVMLGTSCTLDQLLNVMYKAKLPIRDFLRMAFDWNMVTESYDFWEEKNRAFQEWADGDTPEAVTSNRVLEAFLTFLDSHKIREKFEQNRKNDTTYKFVGTTPDETVEGFVLRVCSTHILDPEKLLSYAFKWHDTPEGRDFWEDLNGKWINTYRKL